MGRVAGAPLPAGVEGATPLQAAGLARRLVSTAVLLPVFVWIVLAAPHWLYCAMVVVVAGLAHWEFSGMFERAGFATLRVVGLLGGMAVTASFAVAGWHTAVFTLVVLGVLGASLQRPAGEPIAWPRMILPLFAIGYVNWLLGYGIWLRDLDRGVEWILLLVWVTWLGETAAYLVGSVLGRHKLAPLVSPKKTVEGAVAQFVVSIAAALAAQFWFMPALQPGEAVAVGALLGVAGQIGDLTESALKRSVGTKDTGQLIPGHGGILDRIDSLLFSAPVLFYYASWTGASA